MWVRNFHAPNEWQEGTVSFLVIDRMGAVDYQVQVNEYVWHRHTDQLRTKHPSVEQASESAEMPHVSHSLQNDSGLDESPRHPDVPVRQSPS